MTTAQRITPQSAQLSPDGKKIILGPGPPAWTEFCHTLPHSTWNQFACHWTCDFTPAAAWRIGPKTKCHDRESQLAEVPLCVLGGEFGEKLANANVARVSGFSQQPRLHKTKAWRHQAVAYNFAYPLDGCLLGMEMGTGKSKVAIDLIVNRDCKNILILCPVSVRGVWRREFALHAPGLVNVVVLERGSTKAKTDKARQLLAEANCRGRRCAIVVNYETAKRDPFAAWSLDREWDCVVCDESHRIKSHNSQASLYAAKLYYRSKYRLCLTGTPLGQSPLDLFGQFRFLDPGLFGSWWTYFRGRYAVCGNPNVPQQITGYQNEAELQERFHTITYVCKAADVLDLPPVMHEERTCQLTAAGFKAYDNLETELITDVGKGVVVASNALTRLLRLQQVTSGYLVEECPPPIGNRVHRYDEDNSETLTKRKVLADLLEDLAGQPVVVFCRFIEDLALVEKLANGLGLHYAELSGARKDALTDDATLSPELDVAGVQIGSGGIGVDLSRARYAVYYSLGFSLTEYEQSLARLHRPGQKHPVIYYHLIVEGSVDRRVYRALRQRKQVIEAVLEEYHVESSGEGDGAGCRASSGIAPQDRELPVRARP